MKRVVPVALLALLATFPATGSGGGARTRSCVGGDPGCFSTLQGAIKAARRGAVIRVAAGTFRGGIKITKSLKLVGAGAKATIISGGGPVLTIGSPGARREPTVSIVGVTITGGVTSSDAARRCGPDIPSCGRGYVGVTALGGGVEVAPGRNGSRGATVTISDSVIAGNRVAPTHTVASVTATCPGGPCPFAQAAGGGIDNWGTMTLTNTSVSDNEAAGGVTAQADGGGIAGEAGSRLTLNRSTVSDNRAIVQAPNGRFAAGGAIFVDSSGSSALVIRDGVISGNSAGLSSTYPASVEMNANAGGINAGDRATVTIARTTISGNSVSVRDLAGQPVGFDAGIIVGKSTLVMSDSTVSDNTLTATVGTSAEGGSGGSLETDGYATISNTRITGNSVSVTSPGGLAEAVAVVNMFDGAAQTAVIRDSVISGNSVRASSTSGSATILGAGLANNGPLELVNDQVSNNVATATAPAGAARGGGIFNGFVFPQPTPSLTLRTTSVIRNSVTASPGVSAKGGGLFTVLPVTLDNSRLADNDPDQCSGC